MLYRDSSLPLSVAHFFGRLEAGECLDVSRPSELRLEAR